jgi:hypothetical protein
MILRILIISSALLFNGCLSNNTLMTTTNALINIDKISQLRFGMTQEEVYQIMRYPSKEDQLVVDADCYDIWFYVTKGSILDQKAMVARNFTPLIFKDGIFIGKGCEYYSELVRRSKIVQSPAPTTQPPIKQENIELEKNLKSLPATKKNDGKKSLSPTPAPSAGKPKETNLQNSGSAPANPPPNSETPKEPKPTPSPAPTPPPLKQPLIKPPSKKRPGGPLSMSSKPKQVQMPKEEQVDDQGSSQPKLDEEDREMLDQEREENFNDW